MLKYDSNIIDFAKPCLKIKYNLYIVYAVHTSKILCFTNA